MRILLFSLFIFTFNLSYSQNDSIENARMIRVIEESLDFFYQENNSNNQNYDSIIKALNYHSDSVPKFSNEEYCQRLKIMDEMSPFDYVCNEHTLSTIRFFNEKRRGFIRVVLGRSELYFDLFERKLDEYNLPEELKYLAVIESGLRPQVRSRAGAKGLWQFMYKTGRMYGLKQNSYIDERMDPEKATDAACRYLKKLHEIYNDWSLALAAYNAGPGNVNKAIRRSGNKLNYWEIRPFLPRETRGYVPNFIAASYMMKHHALHNIKPVEATVKYSQLDTLCLKKGVHFETIAELLQFKIEDIRTLNPIYKMDYIPKGVNQPYCVTLPLLEIGKLVALEDSLYRFESHKYEVPTPPIPTTNTTTTKTPPVNPSKTYYVYHKVRAGETLGSIAEKYKTTVSNIKRLNGLRSSRIYVGQRLKVKKTSTPVRNNTNATSKKYYTVRKGDTFSKIARRYGKTQTQLKRLNPGININRLKIGQKIRIR